MEEKELRRYSRVVVDGVAQAPSRAMLRAVGFEEPLTGRRWALLLPGA